MASSLNKVMLMGNITRDIELRHTPSNLAVATIGMAMNHRWRTPEGEQKEDVTFVDCDAWGKTAELIAQYFAKGRPIMIEGRLKLDTWQDKKTNENRSKLKVVIENFYFVDSKPGSGGGAGGAEGGSSANGGGWSPRQNPQPRQSQPAAAGAAPTSAPSAPPPQMDADDIPF
jgi:single-strand DNA-binding protein